MARGVNSYNFLVVLSVALGSFTFGFTVNVTGSVLGMQSFYDYFDLNITTTTGVIGAIPACYFAGGMLGAVVGAWICQVIGRRRALFVSCVLGIVGGVLLGAAVNPSMILLGRALSGICAGAFQTIVPIYQSEISPAKQRGHLVGQHGFFLVLGGTTAVWTGLGCSFAKNPQVQWRLALALSALPPLVLAPALTFLPESPRWLIQKGLKENALLVLEKLHSTQGNAHNTLAKEEYYQIIRQVKLEKQEKQTIFQGLKTPGVRKRLLIAFLTMFLLQSSGVLVIVTYQVILYNNLGVNGWLAIFLLGIFNSWSAIGNFCNAKVIDRVGRVRLLFWGLVGSIIGLILHTIMVARYAGSTNRVGQGFGVAFVFLYTTFYAFCLDVTSYVYCAEIFPTYMRTTGMAVAIVSYFAPALLYGMVAPTAFATIEWRYFLVFIIVPATGLPAIWFYFPETKGLSLEEIAALFGEKVAIDITHMTAEEREDLDAQLTKIDTKQLAVADTMEIEVVGYEKAAASSLADERA